MNDEHTRPRAPRARREGTEITLHGDTRVDPFAWMRAENWREVMRDPALLEPEIGEHLKAENAYTNAVLEPVAGLREQLFEEFRGRIREDDSSVPASDGPFAYYHRYVPGGEHPLFCRRSEGGEEILLDGDALARGHDFFRIASCEHSPDHALLAYAVDTRGSEFYEIRILDLATGSPLADAIESTDGRFAWAADARTLFYTVLDDEHRPSRVYRHRLGTPAAEDVLVYEETDPGFFVGVSLTQSREYVLVDAHDHVTSEVWLVPSAAPETPARVVSPRQAQREYHVHHHGDSLLIVTNADGAEDFKIVEAPVSEPGAWTDRLAHRPGTMILDLLVFREHLARLERRDGLPRLVIDPAAGGEERVIAFDEEAYALSLLPGYEFASATLRFVYSSPTTPQETFDYDLLTGERRLRKRQEIPSGHDPTHYAARRLLVPAHDGESIPVTVLHHRDTALDGSAPALVYGYGAYGLSMPAAFSATRLSLADRGVVHVVAHVRGGTEGGYRWYRLGKGFDKRNTFLDFISVTEHLGREGLVDRARIACHGGSAGGLLVGAVANMRPDLFTAVVGEVPFVDVLSTMSDPDLPLTPPEWPEWGNPLADEAAYRYMRSYSPCDNVVRQPYPHVLATAGLTDPRVTYWEPSKWVAHLREANQASTVNLLHTHMSAGHGGAAGRLERLRDTALVYAFVLWAFGSNR
jgi:oligopeptidase B